MNKQILTLTKKIAEIDTCFLKFHKIILEDQKEPKKWVKISFIALYQQNNNNFLICDMFVNYEYKDFIIEYFNDFKPVNNAIVQGTISDFDLWINDNFFINPANYHRKNLTIFNLNEIIKPLIKNN